MAKHRKPANPLAIVIGKGVRTARARSGFTQARLAELAQIEVVQVSRIERGAVLARIDTLVDLARVLRVRLDDLVGLAEGVPPLADDDVLALLHALAREDRRALDAVLTSFSRSTPK